MMNIFANDSIIKNIQREYQEKGIVKISDVFSSLLPSSSEINRMTDVVFDSIDDYENVVPWKNVLKTMETIKVQKIVRNEDGELKYDEATSRIVLTRIENFIHINQEYKHLCEDVFPSIVDCICSASLVDESGPWCFYKEKLNVKPAGGTGFAAHLDNPSLSVTGLCTEFITLMIAIDDMTPENGCLQVVKGNWNEDNALKCEDIPEVGTNAGSIPLDPDSNGRRGRLLPNDDLVWENVCCKAGEMFIFNGWIPHR